MKNTKINIFASLLIAIFAAGCQKEQPQACFTMSELSPMEGETFFAKNCSVGASSYTWEDGRGNSIKKADNSAQWFAAYSKGEYTITLVAHSSNGKLASRQQKLVRIVPATGKVSFWQSGSPSYPITDVTINGVTRQITSNYPSGINDCGAAGTASFELPVGEHNFTAKAGQYTWNGKIKITIRGCVLQQLL